MSTMEWITVIISALFGLSEALSLIPYFRANGTFQAVYNVLKALDFSGEKARMRAVAESPGLTNSPVSPATAADPNNPTKNALSEVVNLASTFPAGVNKIE